MRSGVVARKLEEKKKMLELVNKVCCVRLAAGRRVRKCRCLCGQLESEGTALRTAVNAKRQQVRALVAAMKETSSAVTKVQCALPRLCQPALMRCSHGQAALALEEQEAAAATMAPGGV